MMSDTLSLAAVRVALAACLLTCGSAAGYAQPVDSFTEVAGVLKVGTIVFVEDDTGQRTKGKVREVSGSSLVVDVTSGVIDEARSFPADQVAKVTRVDSRLNGFLIGLTAGVIPGVLLGSGINQYCYNESPDHCPGAIAIVGGLLGAAGGWAGWNIDGAINGETLVFAKPQGASTARVRLAPVLTGRSSGLALSVTF